MITAIHPLTLSVRDLALSFRIFGDWQSRLLACIEAPCAGMIFLDGLAAKEPHAS